MSLTTTLTVERVSELLSYDASSGVLTWKAYRKGTPIGTKAGTPNGDGYVRVKVDRRPRSAHRLAWMLHYQEPPPALIDHINGDRSDNRICNLRASSAMLNQQNMKHARRNSVSGMLGAFAHGDAWIAQIRVDGKRHHIGRFKTPEAAHAAYVAAKRELHAACTL